VRETHLADIWAPTDAPLKQLKDLRFLPYGPQWATGQNLIYGFFIEIVFARRQPNARRVLLELSGSCWGWAALANLYHYLSGTVRRKVAEQP